jgi:hypothetical protein
MTTKKIRPKKRGPILCDELLGIGRVWLVVGWLEGEAGGNLYLAWGVEEAAVVGAGDSAVGGLEGCDARSGGGA